MFLSPQKNEAEITLIGTGGYGETILIHLGDNSWIIVDSCINPNSKEPLALEYLRGLNVDLNSAIKLVICTHWHDDHILGISKVLNACKSAKLSFAKAHDKDKFLRFLSFDLDKGKIEKKNSSTTEFNTCLEIIEERNYPVVVAVENKALFNQSSSLLSSQVFALSPSDYTMEKFDHEISSLITDFGSPSKKIPINTPNAKSVAIYLKLGLHRAILGADLEVSSDPLEGWINIIKNSLIIDKKASLFKIPHHGSQNGYHEEIWSALLENATVAKLTPWNKGQGLPEPSMLKKYCAHTDNLYMTAPYVSTKPKDRDKQIEKLIKKLNFKLREVKYKKGIIRCRILMDDASSSWKIELLENAIDVCKLLK